MTLNSIDYLVLTLYFLAVVGIGLALKRNISTSTKFLTCGRSVPVWATSLAFVAANLGAQELIGMSACGAKYGAMTAHFYWGGAIPAMVFAGVFMMPSYYGSRARSVPEYLKLRFDEKTRAFNALTFAVMTVFSSGISMYALGLLLQLVLGWDFNVSVLLSAAIVLAYTLSGGLAGAIYNEVMQFILVMVGFAPLAFVGLAHAGGWGGLKARLPAAMTHVWQYAGDSSQNPMGVEMFGLVAGLGFVLAFGYWCTDYLVLQRAMAAKSINEAQLTPLIATFPKMIVPFVVVLPGLIAVALDSAGSGYVLPRNESGFRYDLVLPTLMAHFYPHGMLGLGVTALVASFMSGMAGNVTAFNTVWTYDIYQGHIRPDAPDAHYLRVARVATVTGIAASIGAAYLAQRYNNLMDLLQLIFGFVNAPLFATFLLGMFWKRATGNGAFVGLLAGTAGAALTHGLTVAERKGGWIAVRHGFPSVMAQNFWIAIVAWCACFLVTIAVSLAGRPKPDAELKGLVYSMPVDREAVPVWYRRPVVVALAALIIWAILGVWFW
jgi:solute:Na+ symporter, SSS family